MDNVSLEINPQFEQENIILLNIFPAEIWSFIFQHCTSESCLILSNSSTCIRHWLLSKRATFLFHQVYAVLKDYQNRIKRSLVTSPLDDALEMQENSDREEQNRPNTQNDSHPKCSCLDNLEIRLVCKDWRDGVDMWRLKLLDTYKRNSMYNQTAWRAEIVEQLETKINSNFDFDGFEQIVFTDSFSKTGKCIVRAIVIEEWNPRIVEIMNKIGSSVWYCTIAITRFDRNDWHIKYLNINDALKLLPNLQTLEIANHKLNIQLTELDKLVNVVSNQPLKKLRELEIFTTHELPFPVFNELVRSNSQVKALHAYRSIKRGEYDIFTEPMPALKELSSEVFEEAELESFCLPFVDWQLTKLYITVHLFNYNCCSMLIELCSGKWQETMVELSYGTFTFEGLGRKVAKRLRKYRNM